MKPNLFIGTLVLALSNFFLPKELNFIAICVVLAFVAPYDRTKYYKSGLTVVWPLLVLALIGFFSGINNLDHLNRDFYRDIFAFSRVIIYFIFGILLSKYVRNLATFYKSFSVFVLLASIEHLSLVAGAIDHFNSLDNYRKATGLTNFDEAILLSLVISALFNRHLRQLLKKRSLTNRVVTIVILTSFLTYFSRTMIVTLLVLIFFMADTLNIRKILYFKNRRIFSAVLIVALLFTSLHFLASGNSSGVLLKAFVAKFQRSSEEIFWNTEENTSASVHDIQNSWRGYEAYQGLMKFDEGTDMQQFFGYGFGALVDLGIYMTLSGEEYAKVPILHNGYVFLLVKCGICGLAFYLFFLYRVGFLKIRKREFEDPELYYYYQMLSGLSFLTLINTFTVTGLFNPGSATVPILFGFFWGCVQRRKAALQKVEILTVATKSSITDGRSSYSTDRSFNVELRAQVLQWIARHAPLPLVYASNYLQSFGLLKLGANYIREGELAPLVRVPFEDMKVAVPQGWDACLRRQYGNYIQLPPVEKQSSHHKVLPDPFTPCAHKEVLP